VKRVEAVGVARVTPPRARFLFYLRWAGGGKLLFFFFFFFFISASRGSSCLTGYGPSCGCGSKHRPAGVLRDGDRGLTGRPCILRVTLAS